MFLRPDRTKIDALVYSYLINTLVVLTIFLIANFYSEPVIISTAMLVSNVLAPFSLWMFIAFQFNIESLVIFAFSLVLWYFVICMMFAFRGRKKAKRKARKPRKRK